jgi:hypothetical protein
VEGDVSPVAFPEVNTILGKDQPEYQPLPAHRSPEGIIVTCWRMTWWERIKALWTGQVWARQLTFGDPLQPQILGVDKPFEPAPETAARTA